ncbi:MAG: hypothetical protein EHJ95_01205 [Methanobacteriota archaeon]|nr:MAG: hypothetical protein EHJ95_01205 [Euryarchaeota archaeon]
MGFLGWSAIALPLEYIFLIGIGWLVAIFSVMYIFDIRKWAPEAMIFRTARKKGKPVLDITDIGTGDSGFYLGNKDKKGDIYFDLKEFGDKLDPGMTTGDCSPSRYRKGLNIYHYSTTGWLPVGSSQALGFQKINEIARTNQKYQILDFLSTEDIHQLINTPRDELDHDVRIFINRYEPPGGIKVSTGAPDIDHDDGWEALTWIPDDEFGKLSKLPQDLAQARVERLVAACAPTNGGHPLTTQDVMQKLGLYRALSGEEKREIVEDFVRRTMTALTDLIEEASKTPLEGAYYAFHAAHRDNPIAYAAQDLQHFEMNIWRKARLFYENLEKWKSFVLMALLIIAAIVISAIALHYTLGQG